MPRPRFLKLDAARRTTILDAAKAEFSQHDFEQASFNRIIARADLSKGAMYYYFDDKLDLYLTTLEAASEEMVRVLGVDGDFVPTGDFWELMTTIGRSAVDFAMARPELAGLLKGMQSLPRKAREEGRLGKVFDGWRSFLSRVVVHGQSRDQVRTDLDVGLLVEMMVALDEVIELWFLSHPDDLVEPREQFVDMGLDIYRRLLSP